MSRKLSRGLLWVGVVLLLGSGWAYPGGSWADAEAGAFRFATNYWCDLLRTVGINGEPNSIGSLLAQCAYGSLALSLLLFWRAASVFVRSAGWRAVMQVSGLLSSIALFAVAFLDYDWGQESHEWTTSTAGVFGVVAIVSLLIGASRTGSVRAWRHVWGACMLVAAIVNLIAYAPIVLGLEEESATLPIVQKIGTVFFVLWIDANLRDLREVAPLSAPA